MSNKADLETARDNIIDEIKAVSASLAPQYSNDGQSVQSKAKYLKELREALTAIKEAIVKEDGPFEHQTEVIYW